MFKGSSELCRDFLLFYVFMFMLLHGVLHGIFAVLEFEECWDCNRRLFGRFMGFMGVWLTVNGTCRVKLLIN